MCMACSALTCCYPAKSALLNVWLHQPGHTWLCVLIGQVGTPSGIQFAPQVGPCCLPCLSISHRVNKGPHSSTGWVLQYLQCIGCWYQLATGATYCLVVQAVGVTVRQCQPQVLARAGPPPPLWMQAPSGFPPPSQRSTSPQTPRVCPISM